MNEPIYVGAKDPEGIVVVIRSSTTNLTTVTGVRLGVRRPDSIADFVYWSALDIVSATATELRARYTFNANGLDVPTAGKYVLVPLVTIGGVESRCRPVSVPAEDIYGVAGAPA